MSRFVSVAVPVPALDLLTYAVPDGWPDPPRGARVVVPLGSRSMVGIALGPAPPPPASIEVRPLRELLDDEPFLPADVIELAAWVADYYAAGRGATLAKALPPHALTERRDAFKTMRVYVLTAHGQDMNAQLDIHEPCAVDDRGKAFGLRGRQQEAVRILARVPDGLTSHALAERGVSTGVLARLRHMGLVTVRTTRVERDPFGASRGTTLATRDGERTQPLTADQQAAMAALTPAIAGGGFHVTLLHGITGSGKTEVYLRIAEAVRATGRSVLILVPEIALTPSMATLLRARFRDDVAIQHSGLSDGERHDQWHRIRRGEVHVVVGTRSAVFAPLADVGVIIVDEEHDTSYKQEETPRYHGRDAAVVRGKMSGALVVLGSATPALESYYNASTGRYGLVSLPTRVLARPLAQVTLVNMRDEYAREGPDIIVSVALREAIALRLERREQTVVLLNRRGYATAVFCRQCGDVVQCPNCSVSLTVHAGRRNRSSADGRPSRRVARCHYCNHSRLVPDQCPRCAAPYLDHVGFGTERVESEVASLFPEARIGRVDRDTVQRRGSLAALLDRFARRELDLLVGTQMIAKGHDFPHVTLVGVISADVGLGLADFRASERTFQLLTQVAGRAGRGEREGQAVIQTLFPEHYSIRLACRQDYGAFYEKELEFRQAMHYPPHASLINVVVRGRTFDEAMDRAVRVTSALPMTAPRGFVLLGPAPAPLERLRGEHRVQFFLKGRSRKAMRDALDTALATAPDLGRHLSVDVDPVTLL